MTSAPPAALREKKIFKLLPSISNVMEVMEISVLCLCCCLNLDYFFFYHLSASKLVPLRDEVRVNICACRGAQEMLVKNKKPLICGNGCSGWKNVHSQFHSAAA